MARPGGAQVPEDVTGATGWASFAGRVATEAVECVDVRAEPGRLATGTWFVVADFEGRARAWRFARVSDAGATAPPSGDWQGPAPEAWTTSMDQATYEAAVRRVRAHVRDGDVYQANICRVLSAPLPAEPDARALAARLAAGNPAPTRPPSTCPPRAGSTPCGWSAPPPSCTSRCAADRTARSWSPAPSRARPAPRTASPRRTAPRTS
nr:hypothetical protein GCM10025730_53270 [Promicromonospora thailandica]